MVQFNTPVEEDNDVGLATSIAAGVGSGIFKIFEGAATLGATLLDLGVDKDRAESVEAFFDKINPFDEAAAATGAGKITELIVNIGIPGGAAFKIGSGLTKATLRAKEAGTYLSRKEKLRRFGQGAVSGGVAEGVFVGDVKDAGTFGDFLGGPTEIDRESDTPETELLNRLKFGIEGVAFTGAFGAAGQAVRKIREARGTNKAKQGFDKTLDTVDSWFRSNGINSPEAFDIKNKMTGAMAKDTSFAETSLRDIDKLSTKIANKYLKTTASKIDEKTLKDRILRQMNDVVTSGAPTRVLNNAGRKLMQDSQPLKGKAFTETSFVQALEQGKFSKKINKYTTNTNKNSKMTPIFGSIDEIIEDSTLGRPLQTGKGLLKDLEPGSPLPDKVKKIDPDTGKVLIDEKTGKEVLENTRTGEKIYDVQINRMDEVKVNKLKDILKNRYKVSDEDVSDLLGTFVGFRSKIGELFTSMGRRFTPKALEDFQTMLPKYLNGIVDRGYEVFKNNKMQWSTALNYAPTQRIINQAVKDYQYIASQKGLVLSDELAEELVNKTWVGASIDKGFKLGTGAPGTVRLRAPDFMRKSLQDKIDPEKYNLKATDKTNMAELSGMSQQVVKRLLGKSKSPMNTIVEGVQNLSSQIRENEFYDNLILKNNNMMKTYDEWLAAGGVKSGLKEPPAPFLYKDTNQAIKYAGGTDADWKMIGGSADEAAQNIKIDKWTDSKGFLKDIDTTKNIMTKAEIEAQRILNPLNGKVALADYAESFMKTNQSVKSFPRQLYNNLILYPKGLSQMSKTILAPFTHARNFLSATSFAAANGILPFGNTKDVKAAWNALQVTVPGARKSNEFYQELLDLGVVNSQVQLGDLRKLLEDVDFGGTLNKLNSDYGLKRLLNRLNKIKRGAQDAYTAEDDFWKIFTYLGEKSRIDTAYRNAGLSLGQEFVDPNGVKRIFNDQYLKEEAANLVKNNVPNYAFVSDFIKGLRQLPVGNFVAFPAEIIRTGVNIVNTALKEINYKTLINGVEVKPLASRGRQRLLGMAATTTALPLGLIASTQAIYDITKDEIAAMRRFVPEWSKNSTLIPLRDEDGKMQYIDFSHMNAYDTLTRPITTILNKVNQGQADEDGLIDDFILGVIESTKEIGSPFISESIWTKALQDVAPILGRGGTTADGKEIYNKDQNIDSLGTQMSKSIKHLVEAQAPLNWKQLTRLGISMYPSDSEGRFTERGNEYTFGNEALGILGMRRVTVDPEKSFRYKITDYKTGIRDSRGLFIKQSLKGGVVKPEEIVDAYINSNRALYKINRELYKDIDAAKILGTNEDSLQKIMADRGEKKAFNFLNEGMFRPLTISRDTQELFAINAERLGVPNPYEQAADIIGRIQEVLSDASLDGDVFPDIQNPLNSNLLPDLVGQANQIIGNNPATAAMGATSGVGVGLNNVSIPNNMGVVYNENDPLSKRIDTIAKVDSLI